MTRNAAGPDCLGIHWSPAPEPFHTKRCLNENQIRHPQEQPTVHHTRHKADVLLEVRWRLYDIESHIEDGIVVIRPESDVVVPPQTHLAPQVLECSLGDRQAEGYNLHRHSNPISQSGHEFFFPHEHNESRGKGSNDPLAKKCPTVALDEIEFRADLVGPIDIDVDVIDFLEGGKRNVLILTDREIYFEEVYNREISMQFPFTMIMMELDDQGNGQGTALLGAELVWDEAKDVLKVTGYSAEPIRLEGIQLIKKK